MKNPVFPPSFFLFTPPPSLAPPRSFRLIFSFILSRGWGPRDELSPSDRHEYRSVRKARLPETDMEGPNDATPSELSTDTGPCNSPAGPSDPPAGVPRNPLEVWDHTRVLEKSTFVINGAYIVLAQGSTAAINDIASNQPAVAAYLGFGSEKDFLAWQNEPTVVELSDLYLQGRLGFEAGKVPVGASARRKKE